MKFWSRLVGVFMLASVAYAQDAGPAPVPRSRGPWPDMTLRGPGSQIGISYRDLSPAEGQRIAAERPSLFVDRLGVVIEQVSPHSPASHAGMLKGDRITMFDGQRIRNAKEFAQIVEETPPGRTVQATVIREGRVLTLSVTPTLAPIGI